MHEDNVVDMLIAELPEEDRAALAKEYAIVMPDITDFAFIDRMCADSRSIGLYHTSGLSTPSQVFMDILALTHLVNKDDVPYIKLSNQTVNERYKTFMEALGMPVDNSKQNAAYYTLLDTDALVRRKYDEDFAAWVAQEINGKAFLDDLARKKGIVLMYGPGFGAPSNCVRVSLANLNKEDYVEIARRISELLDEYHAEYQKDNQLSAAA